MVLASGFMPAISFLRLPGVAVEGRSLKDSSARPYLPKVKPEPTAFILLDVQHDIRNAGGEDTEYGATTRHNDALAALTTLQGLINRSSDKKVFLHNCRIRGTRWLNLDGGLFNLYDIMTGGDLIPYPKTGPELDTRKKYPALGWLLRNYRRVLKGAVLAPTLAEDIERGDYPGGAQYADYGNWREPQATVDDWMVYE